MYNNFKILKGTKKNTKFDKSERFKSNLNGNNSPGPG